MAVMAKTFRHTAFRPGIAALLHGNSALAILPTGTGKSMCYQLPAVLMPEGEGR
jgi:ATP-dependent DNA helicase RecQ